MQVQRIQNNNNTISFGRAGGYYNPFESKSNKSGADISRDGSNTYRFWGGAPKREITNKEILQSRRLPVYFEEFMSSLTEKSRKTAQQVLDAAPKRIKHNV